MKAKVFILTLILFVGCTDKKAIMEYGNLRRSYQVMIPKLNFIIEDQMSIFDEGFTTNFEVDPPTYRPATFDEKLKGFEISETVEAVKNAIEKIVENCEKIEAISSKNRLFVSSEDRDLVEMYKEFIEINTKGIQEFTGGKEINSFINPYLPMKMRD